MNNFISVVQNGLEYWFRKDELSRPPIQISIEPTNICNFRCDFCPQSDPEHLKLKRGYMSIEQCNSILQRSIRDFYPDPGDRKISFTHDGEPFLNKAFPEFIKLAGSMKFSIKFASNGFGVTPKIIDDLLKEKIRFNICVDFAADKEMFERYRGFKDSYSKVLTNLDYMVRKAQETGAIFVDICDIAAYYIFEPRKRDIEFEKLKAIFGKVESRYVKFSKRVFHNMAGTVELPEQKKSILKSYRLCPYPWFNLNITWSGDVIPCCRDLKYDSVLGNVFETDSLWNIWNSSIYKSLRKALIARKPQLIKACSGCDLPYDKTRWSAGYILNTVKSRLLRTERR